MKQKQRTFNFMAQIISDWTFYCSPLWKISIQQPITVFAMRCFIFNWTFRNLEQKKRTLAFLQCPATAKNGSIFHTEIWVEWLLHYLYQPLFNTPKWLILEDPGGKIWKAPKISIKRSLFGMLTLPSQLLTDSSFVTTRYDSQSWIKKPPQRPSLISTSRNCSFACGQAACSLLLKHATDLQIKIRSLFDRANPPQQASTRFTFLAKKTSDNIGQWGKNATFTSERMGDGQEWKFRNHLDDSSLDV